MTGAAAKEEHRRDDDVRADAEEQRKVRCAGVPQRTSIISRKVCAFGHLRLTSMARMPKTRTWIEAPEAYQKGLRDAVLPRDVGRLEEGRGPRPLGDDDRGGEAGLDVAARGVEVLRGALAAAEADVNHREGDGEDREGDAEANLDGVCAHTRAGEFCVRSSGGRRFFHLFFSPLAQSWAVVARGGRVCGALLRREANGAGAACVRGGGRRARRGEAACVPRSKACAGRVQPVAGGMMAPPAKRGGRAVGRGREVSVTGAQGGARGRGRGAFCGSSKRRGIARCACDSLRAAAYCRHRATSRRLGGPSRRRSG